MCCPGSLLLSTIRSHAQITSQSTNVCPLHRLSAFTRIKLFLKFKKKKKVTGIIFHHFEISVYICQLRKYQWAIRPAQLKQGVPDICSLWIPRATFLRPLKPEENQLDFRVPTSHVSRPAKEISGFGISVLKKHTRAWTPVQGMDWDILLASHQLGPYLSSHLCSLVPGSLQPLSPFRCLFHTAILQAAHHWPSLHL